MLESGGGNGFVGHVFNFDSNSKEEMLNIVQYALLAVIPVIVLNKSIQRFIPEADDEKGSPELIFEVIVQVAVMFLGIFFIDRFVTYIPTYSLKRYEPFSVTTIVVSVLVITLSLQTRLGEKVNILVHRFAEMIGWGEDDDGSTKKKGKKGKKATVTTSQPITSPGIGTTPITMSTQSQPQMDYDSMYQQQPTPLMGAAEPSMMEPMAANSGGGGAFGSLF